MNKNVSNINDNMNNTNRTVIDQTVLTTGGANWFVLGFAMLSTGF